MSIPSSQKQKAETVSKKATSLALIITPLQTPCPPRTVALAWQICIVGSIQLSACSVLLWARS